MILENPFNLMEFPLSLNLSILLQNIGDQK
ncbi:Uncharacterised protein [Proteus mirabilis]|uniref:Uncharacterized protein n=1 Tax=Proteus mirabilis TaxID=584 RepID=A0A379FJ47_PROMI|nr:Uncharacterised protein [Proteus mirabilis]